MPTTSVFTFSSVMCRLVPMLSLLFVAVFLISAHADSQLNSETFASKLNKFSFNFLKHVKHENENVVYSPVSVSMAVGMLLKGAKGETAEQIYSLFEVNQFDNKQDVHTYLTDLIRDHKLIHNAKDLNQFRNITIELANLILYSKSFDVKPTFVDAMKNEYFAAVGSEDFANNGQQIMQKVNKFVKERTHDLIDSVLSEPLKADTVMFLLNSIYFKAYWKNMFHRDWTHKATFHNSDKTESTIDFLSEDQLSYRNRIDNDKNVTLVELDYLGNASMIFVLPHEKYGVKRIIDTISYNEIENMLANSKVSHIPIKFPKFKFQFETDLKNILPKMGLSSIFVNPDLSEITTNIKVSEALHKAVISVDEGGTEAAAITTLRIIPTSLFTGPEFTADHPFLFFIRDKKSGFNLFAGVVNKL